MILFQKKRMCKLIIFFQLGILMILCACNSNKTPKVSKETIKQESVPDYNIPIVDFDGFKPYLEKQNDTVYVVNFWATWCKPCIEELPYFQELHEAHKEDNIKVVLVSLDFVGNTYKILDFLKKEKIYTCDVVHLNDSNNSKWIDEIHKDWSGSIPATYVYQGNKVKFYEQSFESVEELDEILLDFDW